MKTAARLLLLVSITLVSCAPPAASRTDAARLDAGDPAPDTGTTSPDADSILDVGPRPDVGPLPDTGPRPPTCAARAELIYVIDRDQVLSSFDPRTNSFATVGHVSCASSSLRPFSMSVDRDANAWVLFNDGQIRLVSTADATCGTEAFALADPFERFGMGFSADPTTGTESLYVAGGSLIDLLESRDTTPATLARVSPITRELTTSGPLTGWPELTGNLSGQVFAFYPADTVFTRIVPGRVEELSPTTGGALHTYELTDMGAGYGGQYAFAFWGGRLYVFVKFDTAMSSEIWRFNPPPLGDGTVSRIVDNAGRVIVGAGVSICAPDNLI